MIQRGNGVVGLSGDESGGFAVGMAGISGGDGRATAGVHGLQRGRGAEEDSVWPLGYAPH
jgi:hypothetical protein